MFGDPTAEDIWALARDRHDGISRTEARDLFGRNKKGREIDRALGALEDAGRLARRARTDGHARPAELWIPKSRSAPGSSLRSAALQHTATPAKCSPQSRRERQNVLRADMLRRVASASNVPTAPLDERSRRNACDRDDQYRGGKG